MVLTSFRLRCYILCLNYLVANWFACWWSSWPDGEGYVLAPIDSRTDWCIVWRVSSCAGRHWKEVVYSIPTLLAPRKLSYVTRFPGEGSWTASAWVAFLPKLNPFSLYPCRRCTTPSRIRSCNGHCESSCTHLFPTHPRLLALGRCCSERRSTNNPTFSLLYLNLNTNTFLKMKEKYIH